MSYPALRVAAASIQPLHSPSAFYSALLHGASTARSRILLSCLYLGTHTHECALTQKIEENARNAAARGEPLHIRMQFDHCRSLRDLRRAYAKPAAAAAIENPAAGTHTSAHTSTPSHTHTHTGGYASSAHLIIDLMNRLPSSTRMEAGLTLMPQPRTRVGRLLPPRYIEGAGVCHMKAYVFDDSVILSGANLSQDYFTNRMDRYVVLRDCPELADYVWALTGELQALPGSHLLTRDGRVSVCGLQTSDSGKWAQTQTGLLTQEVPDALTHEFTAGLRETLLKFSAPADAVSSTPAPAGEHAQARDASASDARTCWMFPRLQLGALGVHADADATLRTIRSLQPAPTAPASASRSALSKDSRPRDVAYMATGYFNMTKQYIDALVKEADPCSAVHILTAAPSANGFFGGTGISGGVPMAYSEIERRFLQSILDGKRANAHPRSDPTGPGIVVLEYARPGWSFHGKGLWINRTHADGSQELTTFIGSPNFGRRSVERDLELQFELTTREPGLVHRFNAERKNLFGAGDDAGATVVTPVGPHLQPPEGENPWERKDRQLHGWSLSNGLWIHVASRVLAPFF